MHLSPQRDQSGTQVSINSCQVPAHIETAFRDLFGDQIPPHVLYSIYRESGSPSDPSSTIDFYLSNHERFSRLSTLGRESDADHTNSPGLMATPGRLSLSSLAPGSCAMSPASHISLSSESDDGPGDSETHNGHERGCFSSVSKPEKRLAGIPESSDQEFRTFAFFDSEDDYKGKSVKHEGYDLSENDDDDLSIFRSLRERRRPASSRDRLGYERGLRGAYPGGVTEAAASATAPGSEGSLEFLGEVWCHMPSETRIQAQRNNLYQHSPLSTDVTYLSDSWSSRHVLGVFPSLQRASAAGAGPTPSTREGTNGGAGVSVDGSIQQESSRETETSREPEASRESVINKELLYSLLRHESCQVTISTQLASSDLLNGQTRLSVSLTPLGKLSRAVSSVIGPLCAAGLIEMVPRVAHPGRAGLPLEPGATIPVALRVYLSESAKDSSQNGIPYKLHRAAIAERIPVESISAAYCQLWTSLFGLLGIPIQPSSRSDSDDDSTSTLGVSDTESVGSPGNAEASMSRYLDSNDRAFTHDDVPELRPPKSVFKTEMKPYQARAIFWMTARENPKEVPAELLPHITMPTPTEGSNEVKQVSDWVKELHTPREDPNAGAPASGQLEHAPSCYLKTRLGSRVYISRSSEDILREKFALREESAEQDDLEPGCRGGILADEMGLGKTVMVLGLLSLDSLIDPRKLVLPHLNPGTLPVGKNLIIVPLSLLVQWESEIAKHVGLCNPMLQFRQSSNARGDNTMGIFIGQPHRATRGLSVHLFHEAGRNVTNSVLCDADVVITTYGLLSRNEGKRLKEIHWRRIILDEAHAIKNRTTSVAIAAMKLSANARWCLTGTPIQNKLQDMFPLLMFIKHRPWDTYSYFSARVLRLAGEEGSGRKKSSRAAKRRKSGQGGWQENIKHGWVDSAKLRAILIRVLGQVMIRRTLEMRDGAGEELVRLPERTHKQIRIKLSAGESDFYVALFQEAKATFNELERMGMVSTNKIFVLHLLTLLRQATTHLILCLPSLKLLGSSLERLLGKDSLVAAAGRTAALRLEGLVNKFIDQQRSSNRGASTTTTEVFVRSTLTTMMRNAFEVECPICLDSPCKQPMMYPCAHAVCMSCVTRLGQSMCPSCRQQFPASSLIDLQRERETRALDPSLDPRNSESDRQQGAEDEVPRSTKLKKLVQYVIRDLKHGRHVLIYSQFVQFLNLVRDAFIVDNIPGDMMGMLHGAHSSQERAETVTWFSTKGPRSDRRSTSFGSPRPRRRSTNAQGDASSIAGTHETNPLDEADTISDLSDDEPELHGRMGKVLLTSLRVGGVGLNLTRASTAYLVDLWYNPAVEEQAFKRIHRMGQTRRVRTYSLVAVSTIDDRILQMHDRKRKVAATASDSAVCDFDPQAGNLSLEELRLLFAPIRP